MSDHLLSAETKHLILFFYIGDAIRYDVSADLKMVTCNCSLEKAVYETYRIKSNNCILKLLESSSCLYKAKHICSKVFPITDLPRGLGLNFFSLVR